MMQMNSGIILAGQQPDILGIMGRSNDMAQQKLGYDRQNALADLYQTQGPGIMAGDPGAMNALARHDPQAAMGMQAQQQNMAFDAERMQMARDQAKQAAAEWAAQQDAATVARQADELASEMKGAATFHAAGDRRGYEAYLAQNGLDPAQYPFDQFPAIAATVDGVLEVWQQFKPVQAEFRPATPDEAAQYGATGGQIGPDGKFYPVDPPSGMTVTTNPDGTMSLTQGPGVGGKPLTEAQSKDNVFATRARGALQAFEPVADAMTRLGDRLLGMDPTGVARGAMQSDEFQVAQQSGNEFLQAILRKDTGAAITPAEQEMYGKTYLPQPGDKRAVLDAKAQSRQRALAALQAGMDARQVAMTEKALIDAARNSARAASGASPSPAPSGPSVGDIEDGFRFKGGDPSSPESWEPVP